MSTFIIKEDYQGHIRDYRLDQVTQFDDPMLDKCESRAISFVKSYLSSRYDVDVIFSASGENRDAFILGLCVDVALYYVHRSGNPRKTPQHRKEAYDEAKEWLEGVQMGDINPDLPLPTDEDKDYMRFGSNPKKNWHV